MPEANIFAKWGIFTAQPLVGITIAIIVIAVDIGIIIGSQLWAAPLVTDLNALWVDPHSQVAAAYNYKNKYANPLLASNTEVYTLNALPQGTSSMTKVSNINLWFELNKDLNNIIVWDGPNSPDYSPGANAYTVYDICQGANGFTNWIGCSAYVSTDYFQEGVFRYPQAAIAQYLVDSKFYTDRISNFTGPKANLTNWLFPIIADLATGQSNVWTTVFIDKCLNNNALYAALPSTSPSNQLQLFYQFKSLMLGSNCDVPPALKLIVALLRAWLMSLAIMNCQTASNPCSLTGGGGSPINPADWATPANSLVTINSSPVLTALGLLPQNLSNPVTFAYTAIDTTGASQFPVPSDQCTYAMMQNLTLAQMQNTSFAPCTLSLLSVMAFNGDLASIDPVYNGVIPTLPTNKGAFITAGVTDLSLTSQFVLFSQAQSYVATGYNPAVGWSASNCGNLWGLQLQAATTLASTGDTSKALSFLNQMTNILTSISPYSDPYFDAAGFPVAVRDQQWINALMSGSFPGVNSLLNPTYKYAAVNGSNVNGTNACQAVKPPLNDTTAAYALSSLDNQLPTQALTPLMFGGAQPLPTQWVSGKCVCSPGVSGPTCNTIPDDYCWCSASYPSGTGLWALPKCMAALLRGCQSYFDCTTLQNPAVTPGASWSPTWLTDACTASKQPVTGSYSMGAEECKVIKENLPTMISDPLDSENAVGEQFFKYTFVATLNGACNSSAPYGPTVGGGNCWHDSDCNPNNLKNPVAGTCANLSQAVGLSYVDAFASTLSSASDSGMQFHLTTPWAARYRWLANGPILQAWNNSINGTVTVNGETYNVASFGNLGVSSISLDTSHTVLRNFRFKMESTVAQFNVKYANTAVASVITSDAADNAVASISGGSTRLLILGYGLMAVYAAITLLNFTLDSVGFFNGSRSSVGVIGVVLVAISVASGLGLSLLVGISFSAAAVQIVPFIMLGLGVSDVFVLIRCYPLYHDGMDAKEASRIGLQRAGAPMILVSSVNACVFAAGSLAGQPVVTHLAQQAAIIAAVNYVTIMGVLPAIMALDYVRQSRGNVDIPMCASCCVNVGVTVHPPVDEDTVDRNWMNKDLVPTYSWALLSMPGRVVGMIISIALLSAALYGYANLTQLGLSLTALLPAGSPLYNALNLQTQDFSFANFDVFTTSGSYATQSWQQGFTHLWSQINALPHVVPSSGTAWYLPFMLWGVPKQVGQWDATALNSGRPCDPLSPTTGGKCGAVQNPPCLINLQDPGSGSTLTLGGKYPWYNSTDFYRCLNIWINSDVYYDALGPDFYLVDPNAPMGSRVLLCDQGPCNASTDTMPYSRGAFITRNLQVNQDYVDFINSVRALANPDGAVPSYPIGTPVTYWDQYVSLPQVIALAIGVALLVAFGLYVAVISIVLKVDAGTPLWKRVGVAMWQAVICVAIIAKSIYEMYGFMGFAGITISAIPTVSLIMATGVVVEMICYISLTFMNCPGTRTERINKALDLMFAPTVDGCILTFLGVSCMAASPIPFIVKYFFGVWMLMIFFSIFNALVTLPILLSFVGPPCLYTGGSSSSKTTKDGQIVGAN